MAQCVVCGRPATTQVTVSENGERRQIALCDEHYAEMVAGDAGLGASPLESLFRGGMMERILGEDWPFAQETQETGRGARGRRAGRPRDRSREAVDLQSFLSEAASERLQAAAEKAAEFGK